MGNHSTIAVNVASHGLYVALLSCSALLFGVLFTIFYLRIPCVAPHARTSGHTPLLLHACVLNICCVCSMSIVVTEIMTALADMECSSKRTQIRIRM